MVCLGNICRSPLAEGIMRHKIIQAGLDWEVSSAGTGGYHIGEAPHPLSQKVARMNHIDISMQRANQFSKDDMLRFDRIYVMDEDNRYAVKKISGDNWNEVKVDLLMNASRPGKHLSVPDPWYGKEDGYHEVFAMIDEACDAIVKQHARKTSTTVDPA